LYLLLIIPPPPRSTLFPYTTLFRSMEEMFPLESMGETGENVAERWEISREEQDAFALESQRQWAAASEAGRFDDELVPVGEVVRSGEHTSELQSRGHLVCRLLLEKK